VPIPGIERRTYNYLEITCFLIPSAYFVSSVDREFRVRCRPLWPATFPLLSAKAVSIIFLS